MVILRSEYFAGVSVKVANEILFEAKLNPFVLANQLTEKETKQLREAVIEVFSRQISGTLCPFMVHNSINCPSCNSRISRKSLKKKVFYWCATCQAVGQNKDVPQTFVDMVASVIDLD